MNINEIKAGEDVVAGVQLRIPAEYAERFAELVERETTGPTSGDVETWLNEAVRQILTYELVPLGSCGCGE